MQSNINLKLKLLTIIRRRAPTRRKRFDWMMLLPIIKMKIFYLVPKIYYTLQKSSFMIQKRHTKPVYSFEAADNLALLQLADQIRCWSALGRFPYFLEICSLMRYIVVPEIHLIGLDEVDDYMKFPTNTKGNETKN